MGDGCHYPYLSGDVCIQYFGVSSSLDRGKVIGRLSFSAFSDSELVV